MKVIKLSLKDLIKVINESVNQQQSNTIEIQSSNLNNLFNKFGISVEGSVNELVIQSDALNLNIDENDVLNFKNDITEYMLKIGDMANGIKDWYLNAHNFIKKSMGSDAPLFLMLLGSTSPRRAIKVNLIAAAKIYIAFKRDLVNNKEQLMSFLNDDSVKFGVKNTVDEIPYKLEFLQIGNELNGMLGNMKNIKKIFNIYMSSNQNLSFDAAINWMKSSMSFDTLAGNSKKTVLHKENAISSHKVFNYTMNLLDPLNQSHEYEYVTIDTHMIRYFIPDSREEGKLADIQSKVFTNTKGLYYLLSSLIQKITAEVKKDIPTINSNQTQALIWFIARERYGSESRTDNDNGGTYEKEFNMLYNTIQDERYFIGDMDDMSRVMNYIDENFSTAIKDVNSTSPKMSDDAPF